ncbi:MAG TPA: hypothetical protein VM581_03530 [Magnetospirillaceae bacterium]|nr:hypothetical protein [Magnetospirillaceae bacterium]
MDYAQQRRHAENEQIIVGPLTHVPPQPTPEPKKKANILVTLATVLYAAAIFVLVVTAYPLVLIREAPDWDLKAAHSSSIFTPIYIGLAAYVALYTGAVWISKKQRRKEREG